MAFVLPNPDYSRSYGRISVKKGLNRFEQCFKSEKLSNPTFGEKVREVEVEAAERVLKRMEKDDDKKGIPKKSGGRFISSKMIGAQNDIEANGGRNSDKRDSKRNTSKSSKDKSSSSSSDKSGGSDSIELSGGSSSSSSSSDSKSRSDIDSVERNELSFEMDKFVDTNNYSADYQNFMLNCIIYKVSRVLGFDTVLLLSNNGKYLFLLVRADEKDLK